MSETPAADAWYRHVLADAQPQLSGSDVPWLREMRQQACRDLAQKGFPDRKQEAWRYSPLGGLLAKHFIPADSGHDVSLSEFTDELALSGLNSYRLVFVNGHYSPNLSDQDKLPPGITITDIATLLQDAPDELAAIYQDYAPQSINGFTAMHTALSDDGLYIRVAENVQVDRPVEVVFLSTPGEQAVTSVPGIVVSLGENANLVWLERYQSLGRPFYFQNVVTRVNLESRASLTHYRIVEECADAYHLSTIHVRQHSASRYRAVCMHLKGAWVRSDWHVDLLGEAAQCTLSGGCLIAGQQLSDIHTQVRHMAPACVSDENFKSVVLGAGRMVFDGSIHVAQQAQYTAATMRNDNLLLSENAEVDTKPQLEIYADNVKCSHGSTVGQMDMEQLFYLRSRGIDESRARNLLCQGFIGEIVQAITLPELQDHVQQVLDMAFIATFSDPATADK